MSRHTLLDAFIGATRTSCMIAFILVDAWFLTLAMDFTRVPRMLAAWIGELGLSLNWLLFPLTLFFLS